MTQLTLDAGAARPVRANWGRWVSPCANTECLNAWTVDRGDVLWMCTECWTVTRPVWPADPVAIEWLLVQRPDVTTRNWEPGEMLSELLAENVAHGIIPPEFDQLTDGADVLTEVDGVVISGALLPAIERAREALGLTMNARLALESEN